MSQLKMKLKLNTGLASSQTSATNTPNTSAAIKLNFSKGLAAGSPPVFASSPPPPQSATLKLKTGNVSKKVVEDGRKRTRDEDTDELTGVELPPKKRATGPKITLPSKPSTGSKPAIIRLKGSNGAVQTPTTPNPALTRLKIKARGKLPPRPLGVGYDSEAEDAELDPANEDNLILRMAPGSDCDYLRKAIEERKIGVPVSQGGADVSMRFFTRDGRRAVVNVHGVHYAATLVDLPCIIESMKSWDKRGWWKCADICQMLLVLGQVPTEEAAKTFPLPRELDTKTWQWPHGLTPPMHNVRNRRFRKRVSNRTIEAAEEEVERLLAADQQAKAQHGSIDWKVLDVEAIRREEAGEDGYEDDDAEGDIDDEYGVDELDDEQANAEAMAMMEQALEADDDEEETVAPVTQINTEVQGNQISDEVDNISHRVMDRQDTPAPNVINKQGDATSDDDEDEEEDEIEELEDEHDQDEDEVLDESARERAQQQAEIRVEIEWLEKQLAASQLQLKETQNQLLKTRMLGKIRSFEADLEVKKRALGINDDDI